MAGVVSGVAVAINLLCDVCMLGEAVDSLIQTSDSGENSLLETATVVNALALVGFSIAEIGAILSGQKSESLYKLKSIEMVPRLVNVPLQLIAQVKQLATEEEMTGSVELRSIIRLVEKGIVAPFADMVRTAEAAEAYYEQHFLDMTPEELRDAKRPIYEEYFDGENVSYRIVGYKSVDPEECRANLAKLRISFKVATIVRVTEHNSTVSRVVCDLALPTFQRLAAFFGFYRPVDGAPAAAPHEVVAAAAPHGAVAERELQLNLLEYPNIPEPLHGDQVFRQNICPITQQPIRDPVRDPTNGITLYERRAIVTWLHHNPVSPITRLPLAVDQLQEAALVRDLINHRLQEYQDGLQHFIHQHSEEPVAMLV